MSQLLNFAQSKKSSAGNVRNVCLMIACALGVAMWSSDLQACQAGGSFHPRGTEASPLNSSPSNTAQLIPVNAAPGGVQNALYQSEQHAAPVQQQNTAPKGFLNPDVASPGWQPPPTPQESTREFSGDWPRTETSSGETAGDSPVYNDALVAPSSLEIELPRPGTRRPGTLDLGTTGPAAHVAAQTQNFHSAPQNGMPPLDSFTAPNTNVGMKIGGGQSLIDGDSIDGPVSSTASNAMERAGGWFGKAKSTVSGWIGGESTSSGLQEKFGGANISKIFGSLAVVLGGYFGFVWLMRMFNPRGSRGLPTEVVDVVGQIPFGQGDMLQLVRLGSKLVLLNSGPGGLSPLGEITDPNEVEHLTSLCDSGRSRPRSTRTSRRSPNPESRSESPQSTGGTFRNLMGRLQSAEPSVNSARQIIAGLAGATSGDATMSPNSGSLNNGNPSSANLNSANVSNGLSQGADLDRLVQSLSQAIREQGNTYEA